MSSEDDNLPTHRRRPRKQSQSVAVDPGAPRVTLPEGSFSPPLYPQPGSPGSEGVAREDAWNQDLRRRSQRPAAPMPRLPSQRPPSAANTLSGRDPPSGDAFDLIDRSQSLREPIDLAADMVERFVLDDFTGALQAAELLLGRNPADTMARHYAAASREKLENLLLTKLTRCGPYPHAALGDSEVPWLGLPPLGEQLLALADGRRMLQELITASGLERLQALQLLVQLLDSGAIRCLPTPKKR